MGRKVDHFFFIFLGFGSKFGLTFRHNYLNRENCKRTSVLEIADPE